MALLYNYNQQRAQDARQQSPASVLFMGNLPAGHGTSHTPALSCSHKYPTYHGASSIGCVFTCDNAPTCRQKYGKGPRSFQRDEKKSTEKSDRSTIADGRDEMNKVVTAHSLAKYSIHL